MTLFFLVSLKIFNNQLTKDKRTVTKEEKMLKKRNEVKLKEKLEDEARE